MKKKNKHFTETENLAENPENSIDYVKYIKKLELQRSVLNKILKADLNIMNETTAIDPDRSELRASLRNNT